MDIVSIRVRLAGLARFQQWLTHQGMLVALVAILMAGLARGADAPASEMRTFTNSAGKTLQAQIVNVDNDTVYLKRSDGKSFQLAINTLSTDDQAYLRDWAVKQAIHNSETVFTISATPFKGSESTANGLVHWSAGYKVKLANQTTLHLLNPTIQYILFNLRLNASTLKTTGSTDLKEVPANEAVTFDTKTVNVTQYGTGSGEHYMINKPVGIWVRVYDSNQQLVQEWAEPLNLLKTETWDSASPAPRSSRKKSSPPPSSGDTGGGSGKADAS